MIIAPETIRKNVWAQFGEPEIIVAANFDKQWQNLYQKNIKIRKLWLKIIQDFASFFLFFLVEIFLFLPFNFEKCFLIKSNFQKCWLFGTDQLIIITNAATLSEHG